MRTALFCLLSISLVLGGYYAPETWVKLRESVAHSDPVNLFFALPQRNMDKFYAKLDAISFPSSPDYGKWMSKDEILDMIAPEPIYAQKVMEFIRANPLCASAKISDFRDSVKARVSAACASSLFKIKLAYFIQPDTKFKVIRRDESGPLPDYSPLDGVVEFITGLHAFMPLRRNKLAKTMKREREQGLSFKFIVPQTLKAQYNIPQDLVVKNASNIQAVIEYLPEGAPATSDLQMFAQGVNLPYRNYTNIVGPYEIGSEGESVLDVELITHVAQNASTWYITIGDGWMYETAMQLFSMPSPPLVNSISYGWPEEFNCQSSVTNANCTGLTSQQYTLRANAEFAKVAARGVSVIVADQDEGAPSEANIDCSLDATQPVWSIYPAASPYVTAVSATTLQESSRKPSFVAPPICTSSNPCSQGGTEVVTEVNNTYFGWTTGGGFSIYGSAPTYQKTAVDAWKNSGAFQPPSKFYNINMRAYPEIAAVGDRILVTFGGGTSISAGTSASTPIVSAVVTLLNEWRLNNKKTPLGFLNPLLWEIGAKMPLAFNDVTLGDNRCSEGTCCTWGYGASKGWDPASGWGSPNYQGLLAYIKKL